MPEFMSVMLADDGVVFVSVCCLALSQMALSDVFLRIREKNFMRGRLELIAHAEHRLQRDLPHMYLSRNGMMIGPRNIRMEAVLENPALAHIYPFFSWAFGPQIHPFSGTASWDPQDLSAFL